MNTVTGIAKLASNLFKAGRLSIPQAAAKAAKEKGFGSPSLTLRVLIIVNDAQAYNVTEKDTLIEAVAKVLGTHGADKKNGRLDWKRRMMWISPPSRKPVQMAPAATRTFKQPELQLELL